jgi:hypothetical protein
MYVYNIHLELQVEIELRYVVSYFYRNRMNLLAIDTELAVVYHKDEFDENKVKYYLHEIKLHCSDLSDRPSPGRLPLEDINAWTLQVLEAEPWSSVRMIAEFLEIPASTVHLHLATSLNMKSRHFKWVPHFLDDDVRAKRLEGSRQLLDVLQTQETCHFRDQITWDEIWVYLDMKPGVIWLPVDAELPVRVERTVASKKRMLIIFWGIHGISYYCWLPKDSTWDSPVFVKKC